MKQEKRKLSLGKLTITNLGLADQVEVRGGDPIPEPTLFDKTCTNCTCQTDHLCWY
jgi:hypothetical protein